jgi:L-aspartate semialdehyde sulfurtransferase ferredoxin
MSIKRVRFTFPEDLIKEPLIYNLGHEFKVITNVRMADVDEKTGWVTLELEGDSAEIDRSLAWAQGKGVRVDPVAGDVVEG